MAPPSADGVGDVEVEPKTANRNISTVITAIANGIIFATSA